MKLRSILTSMLAVALLVGLTTSCEDELQPQKQDVVKIMKGTTVDDGVEVDFLDAVNQGEEFTVTFLSNCGTPVLEKWTVEGWETLTTGSCEDTELSATIDDYGVYTLRVNFLSSETCECEWVELTSNTFEITVCRLETAYAADDLEVVWDDKKAWWYDFDVTGYDLSLDPPVELVEGVIFADQDVPVGTIVYDGFTLTIVLDEGWMLDPDCLEPVKVSGYLTEGELPNKRPIAGKMEIKDYDVGLDGELIVTVDSADDFFVVHLDLKTCDVPYYGPIL